MRFSSSIALAAAAFGMAMPGANASDHEAVVDSLITVKLTTEKTNENAVQETAPAAVEGMIGEDVGKAVTGTGGNRKRERDLANVIVLDGTTHSMTLLNSDDEEVTIEWNSVDYLEREVSCSGYEGLGGGLCYQILLQYRAIVIPTYDGSHTDNVDSLELFHVEDEWKETARSLLKAHVEGMYEGKVVTQVKVDDHIYISTWGDPHFKTFSGSWFDYMGECDLKMVHAPSFDGPGKPLDINVRTKIRYDYSYVESAALQLGDDVLEVGSYGEYWLNGVANAQLPATVGGYTVTRESPSDKVTIFTLQLSNTDTIILKNFKDMVAVILDETSAERFRGSVGMVGSFDKHGKMVGRDGETVMEDPNEFAAEWQIRSDEPMLFNVASGPQHPEQCRLPDPAQAKGRRLGESIALEAAEKACAKWAADRKDACVHDVMAIGDLELATAGAF